MNHIRVMPEVLRSRLAMRLSAQLAHRRRQMTPSLDGRRGRVIRVSADKNSMPHGLRCLVHPDSQKQEFREGRL